MKSSPYWYKGNLSRLLMGVGVSLVGSLLVSCRHQTPPQPVIKPIVAKASGPSLPEKYEWQPISYLGHSIVAIGKDNLPFPLHLPHNLKPLGSSALLEIYTQGNGLGFTIYFAKDQEAKIRKWTNGFPADCPFPQGSYTPGSLRHHTRDLGGKSHLWHTDISVRGSFDYANILFQPAEMPSPAEMSTYTTGTDEFSVNGRREFSAWTMANSPIRNQNKWIEMSVFFHSAKEKGK